MPVVAEDGRTVVPSASMRERLERHLAGASDAYFGNDHDVGTTVITNRNVPEAIVRFAADYRAWLVVVGTHGRTGAARFFIGSVAERTVRLSATKPRRARCALLMYTTRPLRSSRMGVSPPFALACGSRTRSLNFAVMRSINRLGERQNQACSPLPFSARGNRMLFST